MSRILLSHSCAHNSVALALGSWLGTLGSSDYFNDVHETRGIPPGERWMIALAGAANRCEAVIFGVWRAWQDSK